MPPGGPLGVGGLDGLAVQKILDPDDPLDLGVVAAVGEWHSLRRVRAARASLRLIADLAEDASTLLYPGERRKFANGRGQPRSAVGAVQAWVISGQPRIDIT